MSNKIITTVRDATETEKGVSILQKQPGTGDIKGICLNPNSFYFQNGNSAPICIGADENGLVNFEAGDNVTLEAIKNGLKISSKSGSADPKIVMISDDTTITRIAEDRTIYIIENTKPVKSTLELPPTARLGFWFEVINIHDGCNIIISREGGQTLKFKDSDNEKSLTTRNGWDDFFIVCFEENKRFKWLTFGG